MRIQLGLDAASIDAAIKQVNACGKSLEAKCDELSKRLSEYGVEIAKITVRKDTGELEGGIGFEKVADGEYLVVSEGEYAMFVEFGTGVVGQGTYPGELPAGYSYDERRTPAAHDPNDPTKWYYRDRDGIVRSTRGQTASAYMATSAEQMRQAIIATAKEVFKT